MFKSIQGTIEDTSDYWLAVGRSEDPYSKLLLGRSEREYYREGRIDAKRLLAPVLERARKKFKELTVLEIGSGMHRFAVAMDEHGILTPRDTFVGLDIAQDFLTAAPSWARTEIAIEDVPRSSVHVAYSIGVFQHLADYWLEHYSDWLRQIVAPGGLVFIQFPNAQATYYVEDVDLHRFTDEEVRALFPSRPWRSKIDSGNLCRYLLDPNLNKEERELFLLAERK